MPVYYAFYDEHDRLVLVQPRLCDPPPHLFKNLDEFLTTLNSQFGKQVFADYKGIPMLDNLRLLSAWKDSCRYYKGNLYIVDYGELRISNDWIWEEVVDFLFMFNDKKVLH